MGSVFPPPDIKVTLQAESQLRSFNIYLSHSKATCMLHTHSLHVCQVPLIFNPSLLSPRIVCLGNSISWVPSSGQKHFVNFCAG